MSAIDGNEVYCRKIEWLVEHGYGWTAIRDITDMMNKAWNAHEAVLREAKWERDVVRKVLQSDKSNKHKVETLQDIVGGVDHE